MIMVGLLVVSMVVMMMIIMPVNADRKVQNVGISQKLFCGSAITANSDVEMFDISTVWNYMNSLMRPPTVLDKLLEYWPQSPEMQGRSRRGGKCH